MASSLSVCVSVAISPRPISFLMTSGTATPRYSATSLTVEPELTRMTSAFSALVSCATGSSYVPRRRRPPRRRGGRFGRTGRRDRRRAATGTAAGAAGTARGLRVDDDAADAAAGTGRARPAGSTAWAGADRCRRAGQLPAPGLGLGFGLGLGGGARFSARGARAVPWPKPARACSGCAAGFLAAAPLAAAALGLGLPVSAASASFSSTAVAAAFTSSPYAFRRLMTSGRGIEYCLASSWTRFLAMFGLSLRFPVRGIRARGMRG